jgi:hypothetical protein
MTLEEIPAPAQYAVFYFDRGNSVTIHRSSCHHAQGKRSSQNDHHWEDCTTLVNADNFANEALEALKACATKQGRTPGNLKIKSCGACKRRSCKRR